MSTQLHRSHHFPDLTLPDHCGQIARLSQLTAADEFTRRLGFTEGRPLIVVFYYGPAGAFEPKGTVWENRRSQST